MNALQAHLEPAVRRNRRGNLIAAGVLLVLGVVGLVWSASAPLEGDRAMARMWILSIVAIPAGLVLAVWSLLPHRGLRALSRPEQIVWYYGVSRGAQTVAVMVGFADGKLYRFPLVLISVREGFSQAVFELLRAAAPGAASGFSNERMQHFVAIRARFAAGLLRGAACDRGLARRAPRRHRARAVFRGSTAAT